MGSSEDFPRPDVFLKKVPDSRVWTQTLSLGPHRNRAGDWPPYVLVHAVPLLLPMLRGPWRPGLQGRRRLPSERVSAGCTQSAARTRGLTLLRRVFHQHAPLA